MRRRRGRPCGATGTPRFSLAKHIGGNIMSSSSMFASAGSLIRSVFKTSAASMNSSQALTKRLSLVLEQYKIKDEFVPNTVDWMEALKEDMMMM
jgi:hypothetical protein